MARVRADRPANVIAEAARVLAPGGYFLIVDFAPHELEELSSNVANQLTTDAFAQRFYQSVDGR